MSYFDDASLVFIPSGTKTSKVYSVKPIDGTGDLTFSRSNDTASRVASNGLIERVRTNVCLYSEQADNAFWGKERLTITANATANPIDGATTADKMVADSSSSTTHNLYSTAISVTSGVIYVVSAYFKKAEYNYAVLGSSATAEKAWFNLNTGVKGAQGGSVVSYDMVSVGNGWYRCYAAIVTTSGSFTAEASIANVDGSRTISGVPSGGIFCFGFQLESGDVMTNYIATTTAAVSVGPVANVPRLDYLNSSCPRLLLEPQRTNVALYSEQLNDGVINKLNTTVTANNATSPDGTQNADLIIETITNGIHICGYDKASITSGTTYTASVFLKKTTGSPDWMQVAYSTTGLAGFANFNLSTGAVGNVISGGSAKIENYGNGWYRCSLTQTANATGTGGGPIIVFTNNTNPNQRYVSYAGSTSVSILAWGLQLEAGAYATSYIPTLGAAVTRGADACSKTGISSLIGQTEGTFFAEVTLLGNTGNFNVLNTNNVTTNSITLHIESSKVRGYVYANSVLRNSIIGGSLSVGNTYKMAYAYKSGDAALYLNGVQIGTASQTWSFSASVDKIELADPDTYFSYQEGIKFAQALLFKTRLSNSDLAALTTL